MIGVRLSDGERELLARVAANDGVALATMLRREGLRAARAAMRRERDDVEREPAPVPAPVVKTA